LILGTKFIIMNPRLADFLNPFPIFLFEIKSLSNRSTKTGINSREMDKKKGYAKQRNPLIFLWWS